MPEREGEDRTERERERERPFPKTFEARAVEVLIFPLASRNPLEKKKKRARTILPLRRLRIVRLSRPVSLSSVVSLSLLPVTRFSRKQRYADWREEPKSERASERRSRRVEQVECGGTPACRNWKQLAAPPSHRAPRTPPNKAHGALELLSFSRNLTINRKKGHLLGAQQQL